MSYKTMLGQAIIPIYLPMPTGGSEAIPADEAQIAAYILVGLSCLILGVLLGFLCSQKLKMLWNRK